MMQPGPVGNPPSVAFRGSEPAPGSLMVPGPSPSAPHASPHPRNATEGRSLQERNATEGRSLQGDAGTLTSHVWQRGLALLRQPNRVADAHGAAAQHARRDPPMPGHGGVPTRSQRLFHARTGVAMTGPFE